MPKPSGELHGQKSLKLSLFFVTSLADPAKSAYPEMT